MASRKQLCSKCGKKCRATLNMCPTCHPVVSARPISFAPTPGPWDFGRTPTIAGVKTDPGWFIGPAGRGHDIAHVHLTASQNEETQEANARLMAASPEGRALAEAVQELISASGELNTRTSDFGLGDLRRMADAFLTKAIGGVR